MMAEAYSLSVWPSSFALESKLSRNLESHTGLVPRLSHHGGKNIAYAEKQFFSHAAVYLKETLFVLTRICCICKKENVFNVFAFGDFKARSAAMVVMMDDENSFSIRHQQQQRKS